MEHSSATSPEHRTFSRRFGYEPLPAPMRLEELSADLRRELWNAVRRVLLGKVSVDHFYGEEKAFVERVLGTHLSIPEDEVTYYKPRVMRLFKHAVLEDPFNRVIDLLELLINDRDVPGSFLKTTRHLFEKHVAAYWLDVSSAPYRFLPRSSKAQGEATHNALQALRDGGMDGADTHFRNAGKHIKDRAFADAVRESVHGVESVARVIAPKASKELAPALKSLAAAKKLRHPALNDAFLKLYGYASDEQGIRHALLDKDSPDVGLEEAMFMFGACAAFAAYLLQKHQQSPQAFSSGSAV